MRNSPSVRRRHLATAVTAVLAITVGTLAATPALAAAETATPSASGTTEQEGAAALLPDSTVLGNGPTGFLTRHRDSYDIGDVYRWTRYKDGVTTVLPQGTYTGGVRSDVVVKVEGTTYKLYDMATGAAPVVIDAGSLGTSAKLVRVVGATLVLEVPRAGGGVDVHLLGKPGGTLVDNTVSGLPATAAVRWYDASSPDTLVIRHGASWTSTLSAALVDVATATVVENRVLTAANYDTTVRASATHLAWAEHSATEAAVLRLAKRGEAAETRLPLGTGGLAVGFLGADWVAYAATGGTRAPAPNPLHSLTARSLTGDRTVKLLDTVTDIRGDAEGGLLVQGGTIEHGEGLYRITPGQDGADPTATLVASTGRPIVLELASHTVPATVDFTTVTTGTKLDFQFAGPAAATVRVQLTHTASGKHRTLTTTVDKAGRATLWWTGTFDDSTAASNGDYTWRMTAQPTNGIGSPVERAGALKVASKPAPHDFSDSGSPDLAYWTGGHVEFRDARQTIALGGDAALEQTYIGGGWTAYDQVVTPGNVGGSAHSDLLARDKTGVLWFYAGNGKSGLGAQPFATRTRIGGGWGAYNKITAGSDLTGDGRPDLVATDTSGALWLYKGTGNATTPFATRTKIGGGWGVYNSLTATGNIAGAAAGDLVARDRDGVLWLYLGKGDGTFAARTRIGGGWNVYEDIVAIGDVNRDGRNDLLTHDSASGRDLVFQLGTGDWRAPFRGQVTTTMPTNLGPVKLL
ncbi:FG-GAP repeat domain-containing protein [Streptomyces narbonensis]|uniref:FG-GAP repeat domain-containing protein n=1 Tax=Streptomyces narbonensis TaxID=67333 RepID=UPI0033EB7CFC